MRFQGIRDGVAVSYSQIGIPGQVSYHPKDQQQSDDAIQQPVLPAVQLPTASLNIHAQETKPHPYSTGKQQHKRRVAVPGCRKISPQQSQSHARHTASRTVPPSQLIKHTGDPDAPVRQKNAGHCDCSQKTCVYAYPSNSFSSVTHATSAKSFRSL